MFARFRLLFKTHCFGRSLRLYNGFAERMRTVFHSRPTLRPIIFCRFLQKQTFVKEPTTFRVICNKMFTKYLLATNTISSAVLMMIGDFAAQEIHYFQSLKNEDRYDYHRLGRMFVVGSLIGPVNHTVYTWMEKVMPARSTKYVFCKILIDQLFVAPTCISIFFYSACYFEKKSVEETNRELVAKFPLIYSVDLMTWPMAQYINFRYVDIKYRVIYVNVVTAVYNVFLSYIKHSFHLEF